jgi:hypothetical protein
MKRGYAAQFGERFLLLFEFILRGKQRGIQI